MKFINMIAATFAISILAACGGGTNYTSAPNIGGDMMIAETVADRLTSEQYERVLDSFNSAASGDQMIWPSVWAGNLEASGLLSRALNTNKLPAEFVTSHGPSPVALNVVLGIYKQSLARGFNEDLQRAYFRSKWGGRDVRSGFVAQLVKLCPSATEEDKSRAFNIWSGNSVGLFKCAADPSFNEYRLPGRG